MWTMRPRQAGSAPTARARQRYRESSSPYSRSRPGWIRPWCFACLTLLPTAVDWMGLGFVGIAGPTPRRRAADSLPGPDDRGGYRAGSFDPESRRRSAGWFTDSLDPEMRRPFLAAAASVFRSAPLPAGRRAEALMQLLDPGGNTAVSTAGLSPIDRLSLGIGWFASGDDDAGNRLLNEARETLFLDERLPIRERTELAIAYAARSDGIGPHRARPARGVVPAVALSGGSQEFHQPLFHACRCN